MPLSVWACDGGRGSPGRDTRQREREIGGHGVCVCVCVYKREKKSSVHGPRAVIISLSAVAGVGPQRVSSVSFCHNMSH